MYKNQPWSIYDAVLQPTPMSRIAQKWRHPPSMVRIRVGTYIHTYIHTFCIGKPRGAGACRAGPGGSRAPSYRLRGLRRRAAAGARVTATGEACWKVSSLMHVARRPLGRRAIRTHACAHTWRRGHMSLSLYRPGTWVGTRPTPGGGRQQRASSGSSLLHPLSCLLALSASPVPAIDRVAVCVRGEDV